MISSSIQPRSAPRYDLLFVIAITALTAFWALFAAARAEDIGIAVHSWLLLIVAFVTGATLVFSAGSQRFVVDSKSYSDGVIRYGVVASTLWGIVGMLVGVIIASQLAFPEVFYVKEFGFLNFGRLRPLHTSAVVFAFGGNVLIATSFYVVQRTCRARLFGGILPWFVFWGYQLFIVLAGSGYLLGVTSSLEYAEPTW